jgi:hypothetical protein
MTELVTLTGTGVMRRVDREKIDGRRRDRPG